MRIVTHPENVEELKKTLKISDVHEQYPEIPFGKLHWGSITIHSNRAMEKTRGTGRYKKKGEWLIEDEDLVDWDIDKDGFIINPSSWMITLGLLEEEQAPYYIVINDNLFLNHNYDFMALQSSRGLIIGSVS